MLGRLSLRSLFKDPIDVPINDPNAGPNKDPLFLEPAQTLVVTHFLNVSDKNVKITHPIRMIRSKCLNMKYANSDPVIKSKKDVMLVTSLDFAETEWISLTSELTVEIINLLKI